MTLTEKIKKLYIYRHKRKYVNEEINNFYG